MKGREEVCPVRLGLRQIHGFRQADAEDHGGRQGWRGDEGRGWP